MRNTAPDAFYIRSPRLNQLLILKELALDPNLTQAELARRCDLSVAMVNNYMKELSGLGWLQYHRKSSKNVSYHLTPAGQQQIQAVEEELVREMIDRFAASKASIRERILAQVPGGLHRVVLVGSGDLAEITFHALDTAEINIVGICDFQRSHVGRELCGRKILDPTQILYLKPDAVIVAETQYSAEVFNDIRHLVDYGIQIVWLGGSAAGPDGDGSARDLPVDSIAEPSDLIHALKAPH